MDTSKFIAKILGLIYLSIGLGFLISSDQYRKMYQDMWETSASTFFFCLVSIVAGMAIIKYHNIWEFNWKIWITIIGWYAVIGGIVYLIFPNYITIYKDIVEPPEYYLFGGIFYVAFGLMFAYFGFFHKK